jgi:hypothetical protein
VSGRSNCDRAPPAVYRLLLSPSINHFGTSCAFPTSPGAAPGGTGALCPGV